MTGYPPPEQRARMTAGPGTPPTGPAGASSANPAEPCRNTIHCANWGFCHRCAPAMAEAASHVIKALRVLPESERSDGYGQIMAVLTAARTTPDNPATSSDTADNPDDDPLRHQIFGIALDNLIRFHCSLLHPSTVAVDIADAVMGVRDTELQQLRADLAAETALRHERTELYDTWRGKANELGGVIARVRVTNLCGDCKINVRAALDGPADTTPPAAAPPTHGGNIGWTEPTNTPKEH